MKERLAVRWRRKQMCSDYALEDEYEVDRVLGRGGFSLVKEIHAKGVRDGLHTAVKITSLDLIQRTMGLDRDALEARLAFLQRVNDSFQSEHIVRFLGYRLGQQDMFTFLEVSYGGDLFSRIVESPNGHFTEDEARRATRNLLSAVREIHASNIIHRDIKPENIFYRQPDSDVEDVVLADFGCCIDRAVPGCFYTGQAGSPGYTAPEMMANQPYTNLIDIFSVGVTVYEMLTGRSPFRSHLPEELKREVLIRKIPYPKQYWSTISPEARDCVECMLASADLRWSADELLRHPWLSLSAAERRPSLASISSDESTASSLMDISRMTSRRTTLLEEANPLTSMCTRCSDAPSVDGGLGAVLDTQLVLTGREPRLSALASSKIVISEPISSEVDS